MAVFTRPLFVLMLLALFGCDPREQRHPREPAPISKPVARKAAPKAPFVGPTVVAIEGKFESAGPLTKQARLSANTAIMLAPEASLKLDFANGARVSIQGPSALLVAPREKSGLSVRAGQVTVDYPQSGRSERLWLGSSAGLFWISPGARAAFRLRADAMACAAVAAGYVTFDEGTIDSAEKTSRSVALTPGDRLVISPKQASEELMEIPTLERAEELVRALDLSSLLNADAPERALRALDLTLAALERHEAEERKLLEEHARRVAAKDEGASLLQRRLAEHAASTFRLHEALDITLTRAESTGALDAAPSMRQRAEGLLRPPH